MQPKKSLLTDKDIAHMFGMSASWVRQERFKRRNGQDHTFTVDPVMIGRCPRYKAKEVHQWMDSLG